MNNPNMEPVIKQLKKEDPFSLSTAPISNTDFSLRFLSISFEDLRCFLPSKELLFVVAAAREKER